MKLTIIIILITLGFFVIQSLLPATCEKGECIDDFTRNLALTPVDALGGFYWQFFTYMFLHANPFHIFINMFVLVIFGPRVEEVLGKKRFLILYIASGLGSAFLHIFLTSVLFPADVSVLMLGASGAVFGIVTAYGFLFPKEWIIMFPGIPMPAMLAVVVFAGVELVFGVFGLEQGVANFGHLGGIITGVIFMLFFRRRKEERSFEFIWEE